MTNKKWTIRDGLAYSPVNVMSYTVSDLVESLNGKDEDIRNLSKRVSGLVESNARLMDRVKELEKAAGPVNCRGLLIEVGKGYWFASPICETISRHEVDGLTANTSAKLNQGKGSVHIDYLFETAAEAGEWLGREVGR